jgi:hypothetical protein
MARFSPEPLGFMPLMLTDAFFIGNEQQAALFFTRTEEPTLISRGAHFFHQAQK